MPKAKFILLSAITIGCFLSLISNAETKDSKAMIAAKESYNAPHRARVIILFKCHANYERFRSLERHNGSRHWYAS